MARREGADAAGASRSGVRRLGAALMCVALAGLTVAAPGRAEPRDVSIAAGVLPTLGPGDLDLVGRSPTRARALADDDLAAAVSALARGRTPSADVEEANGRVLVEILHSTTTAAIESLVAEVGGEVTGSVPGALVEARIPWRELERVQADARVHELRSPLPVSLPAPARSRARIGEQVAKTHADDWHAAGITGLGVKVGVVDFFDRDIWRRAQRNGDLPAPSGTFCRNAGSRCGIWTGNDAHGVAVSEAIHEMAPGAEIYIATVITTADLQAAVNWFAAKGVTIISRSLTSAYDGPGDGTGPIATVIDNAVAAGITWAQSAGNSAGVVNERVGSYSRFTYQDVDGNGWLEFAPGYEFMAFGCGYTNGLRWSDFGEGAGITDYDLFAFTWDGDANSDPVLIDKSEVTQGVGAAPLERTTNCDDTEGVINLFAVYMYAAGDTAVGDVLEIMVNGTGVDFWQNAGSAAGPAADTANPGALTVGAVDPVLGTAIGKYSSQGPTNDGRVKPDISAASCFKSTSYAPECFNGTSAATPVVAGAAALVRQAEVTTGDPEAVADWLRTQAVAERGAPGIDNVFGAGELILPPPPEFDTVRPSISITSPRKGKVYPQGARLRAKFSCRDARSGIARCTADVRNGVRIDTSRPGRYSFTVNAVDWAGNKRRLQIIYTIR